MRELQTKLPKGKVVRDRYIVEELLGQGGFGAVYRVRDRRVKGNVFALKEISYPNKSQRESFVFEGEILRRLDHYALPRVYRLFEDTKNNRLCMLMDYIEGPNLERLRLQQPEKRIPFPQVVRMMAPIIDAIIYLHGQQPPIIHRDIKPSNIIIPSSGENGVLVDFGIAKEFDQDSTTTAVRHCSPGYGAPEQYTSGTSTQTDIYGLAATFYTLLTGEVPVDALYRITRMSGKRPDPLEPANEIVSSIPVSIAEALQKAMAVNSNDRFATVEELWETLRSYPLEEPATNPAVEHIEQIIAVDPASTVDPAVQRDVANLMASFQPLAPDTPLAVRPANTPAPARLSPSTAEQKVSHGLLYGLVTCVLLAGIIGGAFLSTSLLNTKSLEQSNVQKRQATISSARPTKISTAATGVDGTATVPALKEVTPEPVLVPASSFPLLARTYNGSIHNTPASVDSSMTLIQIKQNKGTLSGTLALGPGLLGGGNFTGTVTEDNKVQFLVSSYSGLLPLFFQGQILANGSISGTYCSYQNGQCDFSGGGYGTWSLSPASLASAQYIRASSSTYRLWVRLKMPTREKDERIPFSF